MEEAVTLLANPYLQPREYEIMAEIGQGIALPAASKYTVKIQIADHIIRTEKPAIAENTFNRWSFRTPKLTYTVNY